MRESKCAHMQYASICVQCVHKQVSMFCFFFLCEHAQTETCRHIHSQAATKSNFSFPLISLFQLMPFCSLQLPPLLILLPPLSPYFLHKSLGAPSLCTFLSPLILLFLAVFLPSVLPASPQVSDLLSDSSLPPSVSPSISPRSLSVSLSHPPTHSLTAYRVVAFSHLRRL